MIRFSIHEKGETLQEPVLFYVDLPEKLTKDWYTEQVRRHINNEGVRFDIDESYALRQMSIKHLKEFISFIENKND